MAGTVTMQPAVSGDVRELRLALVCYGGVSLAIYMHGVTKELHKLLLASAAYEQDQQRNPFAPPQTESVYWDLLSRMQQGAAGRGSNGVRTRVVVDIISGTSAGGINGVCLAKAIALNRSQDALKALWFDRGDIKQLGASGSWMPLPARGPWLMLRSAVTGKTPLRGDEMCRWLYGAFAKMDDDRSTLPDLPSLLPYGHTLELFVTVTDFQGYRRELPIYDPRIITDVEHRHVLAFRHDGSKQRDFDAAGNHVLAFAARATSSFPGAFPPLTFNDYQGYFDPKPDLKTLSARQFATYTANGVDPRLSVFVDGGVLNNYPFSHAVRAIKAKPAASEVVRRLLYIEPDPAPDRPAQAPWPEAKDEVKKPEAPGWLGTIWAGLSTIPASQPVLDELTSIAERNQIVQRIRDIIEISFDGIRKHVTDLLAEFGLDAAKLGANVPAPTLVALRDRVEEAAAKEAGYSHATYARLRLRFVLEGYAAMIAGSLGYPPDSYQARFVESVASDWGNRTGLLSKDAAGLPAQKAFLRAVDLDYQDRRLQFIISAFSWWYRDAGKPGFPTRAELDRAKARLYEHAAKLKALVSELAEKTARGALDRAFPPDEVKNSARTQDTQYGARHQQDLDELCRIVGEAVQKHVGQLEGALYADLVRLSAAWDAQVRVDLLVRYLGFPFWDILVYPVQALPGVNERDHVEVVRMSPFDSTVLGWPGEKKLKGTGLAHFAAFFNREFRENDYLWGRLDAAERLVGLLLDDSERPGIPADPGECRTVFFSILAEERSTLTTIQETIRAIEQRDALKPPADRTGPRRGPSSSRG
jgi:patatin-related protein